MLFYLRSSPINTCCSWKFTIKADLDNLLELDHTRYRVALLEFNASTTWQAGASNVLTVISNICGSSFLNGTFQNVLRRMADDNHGN
ncbi:hypothetical protein DPMN_015560 [Dreissena polymorpha]|uniref:Uncharacterized protein n=1 Tax=Dreissena polymorpha TaxID=45954 RepID=A0A9D4NBI8_DREPO|nr:hypothetical protein DPMN_015560 [Dreissena polymorpha]